MPQQKFKYDVRAEDLGVPSKLVKRKGDFLKIILRYLFIFGCAGSSLLHGLFSSCCEWGPLSSCSAQASPCRVFSCCRAWALDCEGLRSCDAHGPCCSPACGIFPDQGSNLCLLHGQVDSVPLSHQGSPGKGTLS